MPCCGACGPGLGTVLEKQLEDDFAGGPVRRYQTHRKAHGRQESVVHLPDAKKPAGPESVGQACGDRDRGKYYGG